MLRAPHACVLGAVRARTRRRVRSAARAALTPHEVLGVPFGASAKEIKTAFRTRVRAQLWALRKQTSMARQ